MYQRSLEHLRSINRLRKYHLSLLLYHHVNFDHAVFSLHHRDMCCNRNKDGTWEGYDLSLLVIRQPNVDRIV
jgi:hypothetical protein